MASKLKDSQTKDSMALILRNIEKSMAETYKKSKKPIPESKGFSRIKDIEIDQTPALSFGHKAVDEASFCNGVPRGKIVELFGPESSGKSLLTLFLIANCQRDGLECALVDAEMSFDPIWAKKHGVDVENLVYSNDFDSGEHALDWTYEICKSGAFALVVVDSVAALSPRVLLEGSLEKDAKIGAQALMLSNGLRKIMKASGETGTTVVFINQTRTNVGVMYGNPETTPGGKALKFYAHQRLRVAKKSLIKNTEDLVIGQISEVVFVKNKTARPFGKCEIQIIFDDSALNPVVLLCSALKKYRVLKQYKGLFRIAKGVVGNDDFIDTNESEINYVADYIVKNDLTIPLIEAAELLAAEEKEALDGVIIDMKNNPELIKSPVSIDITAKKKDDATLSELGDDVEEEDAEGSVDDEFLDS
jgi:recombination protein RecA